MPTTPRRYEWPQLTAILARSYQFKESALVTDPGEAAIDQFCSYPSRVIRYAVLWAHYEGNVYRRIRRTSAGMKDDYGLYEYIRSILNPTSELVKFYVGSVMGGLLDQDAGDGQDKPSALPVVIDETNKKGDDLRRAIAVLWDEQHSNWQVNKDTYVRFGAALGDVFLYVEDDPRRERVRIRVVHPRTVESVDLDPYGNVRGYVIREWRPDPRPQAPLYSEVLYTERCTKVGQSVYFETFLGTEEEPFDWSFDPDDPRSQWRPSWTEDYGFVPLFKAQHEDVGVGWGFAAVFLALSLVHEIDDLVSKLDDQIRRIVRNPRMLSGVSAPGTPASIGPDGEPVDNAIQMPATGSSRTDDDDEAARGDVEVLYCPNDRADVKSFLGDMDIQAVSEHIQYLRAAIEKKLPELADDRGTSAGDASGRALQVYRQAKEKLARAARVNYFATLVRAIKGAISIGGQKGYPGFEAFDEGSFDRGELDFKFGENPVYEVTESDRLEIALEKATALKMFIDAGMPMGEALRAVGYDDEGVERILREKDGEDAKAEKRAMERQAAMFGAEEGDADELAPDGRIPRPAGQPAGRPVANGEGQAVPLGQDGRFSGR